MRPRVEPGADAGKIVTAEWVRMKCLYGGCRTCASEGPCAAPERARPLTEGCGSDMFTTVRDAGWELQVVHDKGDEYSFFALVLAD